MKILALLVSLLLGAAVLLVFLQPWGAPQTSFHTHDAPANPFAAESTAAVDTVTPKPAEVTAKPATHMLANEKPEAERSAALDDQMHATALPARETRRYFKVRVRDAETLEAGLLPTDSVVIRLEGIDAREADETCKKESGATWPCGTEARAALAGFIRYRAVTCTLPPGGEIKDFVARCSVMGQDLSTWLVRQGWAMPQAAAEPTLAKALDTAKTEHRGLWQAD